MAKKLKKLLAPNAADPSARPGRGACRNPLRPGVTLGRIRGTKKTYLKGWVV